jgi:hypothetical protein
VRARDAGPATPTVVAGDDGVLLALPGGGLARLDGRDLRTRWELPAAGVTFQRTAAVLSDFDRDGVRELAVPEGLYAIRLVDRDSGRLLDRLELPEVSLLALAAARNGALLAAYRDRGVFVLRASDSRRSALLAELEDALARDPAGP